MLSLFLLNLFCAVGGSLAWTTQCPSQCICEGAPARVWCLMDDTCSQEVFLGEVDELVVEGPLCKSQREDLSDFGQYKTLILQDEDCGYLEFCSSR